VTHECQEQSTRAQQLLRSATVWSQLLCPCMGSFHLTQCGLGQAIPPYQVASRSIQPFGHNRHGLKIGGMPLFGESWVPIKHNMSPGPRPTFVPSGILIHPVVWLHRHRPKIAGCCSHFFLGRLGLHLTQYGLGRGLLPCQVAS